MTTSPMPTSLRARLRQVLVAALCTATAVLTFAVPASAHDPIFLTADQTTPDTGPYMPDGAISWALYGSLLDVGDTRGFEFDLRDGDPLVISLLLPNQSPETELTEDQLPYVELTAPDGTTRTITANMREIFDEPFSRTSYVTLYEEDGIGEGGRYSGIVVGQAPTRFSVAIGINEIFFTETERSGDRPTSFAEISGPLTAWYSTPVGAEVDPSLLAEGEGEIDLDLIEEAMESGVAEAPEEAMAEDAGEAAEEAVEDEAMSDDAVADDAPETATEAEEAAPVEETETESAATTETTESATELDGASETNLGWVAPVGLLAVAVIAGGFFAARGRKGTSETEASK